MFSARPNIVLQISSIRYYRSLQTLKQFCTDENVVVEELMMLESKVSAYHTDKMLRNARQTI